MITNKEDYIYIYNYIQANFYIENDIKVHGIGKNKKTDIIYFIFLKKDTHDMFEKWKEYKETFLTK